MKKALFTLIIISIIAIGLTACQPAPEGPLIEVSGAWGRPSPMAAGNGASYMLIENKGSEADRLINVTSNVSDAVELHDMTMEDGVMKMFHVEEGYEIPAGGSVELKPGGKHVMFIGLHDQLVDGQVITIDLEFEKSGKITVEAKIREE